jgi:hypothetical protein
MQRHATIARLVEHSNAANHVAESRGHAAIRSVADGLRQRRSDRGVPDLDPLRKLPPITSI